MCEASVKVHGALDEATPGVEPILSVIWGYAIFDNKVSGFVADVRYILEV